MDSNDLNVNDHNINEEAVSDNTKNKKYILIVVICMICIVVAIFALQKSFWEFRKAKMDMTRSELVSAIGSKPTKEYDIPIELGGNLRIIYDNTNNSMLSDFKIIQSEYELHNNRLVCETYALDNDDGINLYEKCLKIVKECDFKYGTSKITSNLSKDIEVRDYNDYIILGKLTICWTWENDTEFVQLFTLKDYTALQFFSKVSPDPDFRNLTWGASRETVKSIEGEPYKDGVEIEYKDVEVFGEKSYMLKYLFENGKLIEASFYITNCSSYDFIDMENTIKKHCGNAIESNSDESYKWSTSKDEVTLSYYRDRQIMKITFSDNIYWSSFD